jgi:hypothetical protein
MPFLLDIYDSYATLNVFVSLFYVNLFFGLPKDGMVLSFWNDLIKYNLIGIPYFIKYNAQTCIMRTWISQWILAIFLFIE